MFHYVIAWSAITFLMGATVYYGLQKHGDLYYHQQSLLSQFPLHTSCSASASGRDVDMGCTYKHNCFPVEK